jgi:ribosomal protein S18 acetylase RimI-like enzyme
VKIRRATEADLEFIRALWEEFEVEIPPPQGLEETFDEDWVDTATDIRDGAVYIAEDDDGAVGYVRASRPKRGRSHVNAAYVRPRARRHGVTKALLRAAVGDVKELGATHVTLDVLATNAAAIAVWRRLGFGDEKLSMATPLDALEARLAELPRGETRAWIHVQSDDRVSIDRAVASFVPRLDAPEVTHTANGWIRVGDPTLTADRDARLRLAREFSHRLGAVVVLLSLEEGAVVRFLLYERGRMVDEYLSVPSYYGELPTGDELALAANATLVSRLTGADREEVRRVVRTAAAPAELPPAPELYEQIARLMGVEP